MVHPIVFDASLLPEKRFYCIVFKMLLVVEGYRIIGKIYSALIYPYNAKSIARKG